MTSLPIYPLQFEPIYQYRLWGGRRLEHWLQKPLPDAGPVGEAWLLSDRKDNPSRVADGPLKGLTIADLIERDAVSILGDLAARFTRFPLLLKYLDVSEMLSVQVHPSDDCPDLIPAGETGKTEAWLVLEADPRSRIYAGLKPGVTDAELRSLSKESVDDCLPSFRPMPGQVILIEAGVVHSLGNGVVVLEVQQNSDITYRLYDWGHIEPKTSQPRPLQIEQALTCINAAQGVVEPVALVSNPTDRLVGERLLDCPYFRMRSFRGSEPFAVGLEDAPTVLVCVEGIGKVEHDGADFGADDGAVTLLPAAAALCRFRPTGPVTLIEISVPPA